MSERQKIGSIMKAYGYITEDQLQEALDAQARSGESRLLGQILVARGYATKPQIQVALSKQSETEEASV